MPARTRSLRSSLQPPCSPPSPDPARRPSVPMRAEGEGARRLTETVRRRRLSRPPNGRPMAHGPMVRARRKSPNG
ncbi:hypothetical protein VFPBJ_01888 [Purpureocillium lilacinum]|uniref:Uncharacterized protein n=1 Tax=Purpureocillium lilacinum TaxID=33203 RepID=A0A179HCA1_PURLI|nr:hypothetical protein VFPBJ_01888 [Purpureocillium lilacinum]